jgi:hypothetical protein
MNIMRYWLLPLDGSGFSATCKMAGDFLTRSADISFSSRGLPDGANSRINEQKELICFDIIFFYELVLKCSYTHKNADIL